MIKINKMKKIIIGNWIAASVLSLFFVAHLYKITAPPVDEHSWRQTDTAGVSRNFTNESANILFPRVDGRGQFTGITGMEFPIYNYTTSLTDRALGFAYWHGRAVTLLAGMAGLVFFYLLMLLRYSKRIANYGIAIMALSPLYFYFSRNIQPDILMVSLSVASLYLAQMYTKKARINILILLLATFSLAVLVKIPAAFILIPMVYILWPKRNELLKPIPLISLVVIVILPNIAWYIHSDQLSKDYGLGQYYYGELGLSLVIQHLMMPSFWRRIFISNTLLKTTSALFALSGLYGLFITLRKRDYLPFLYCLAISLFLVLFANKSYYHNYYSLPIVPALAMLSAVGIDSMQAKINKKIFIPLIATFFVFGIIILGFSTMKLYKPQDPYILELKSLSDKYISPGSLIITDNGGSPAMLYFADRKGWDPPDSAITASYISSVKSLGAHYLIIRKPNYPYPDKNSWSTKLIYSGDHYEIYSIN